MATWLAVAPAVGKGIMSQFVTAVIAVYLAMMAGLYLFQRNLLYLPDTSRLSPAARGVAEMRPVSMQTEDGLALVGWYREARKGQPTLVYFHGNAGNVGDRGFKVRPYLDAGFGVLLAGYRGYGGNPGSPSEKGFYADGRAALKFLRTEGVAPEHTVLYGESLGSGVAVHLAWEQARHVPVAAVILESPYTSMTDLAAHHYPYVPVRWLLKDRYESVAKIGAVKAPVMVLHGVRDRTIPVKFGRRLFEAAADPKEAHWLEGAAHNDLYDHDVTDLVIDFLVRRAAAGRPRNNAG